jgi:hydrogenase nickel incorporation protein HypA/HybF
MHELSVSESILEIVLRHGQEHNAKKITDIYLVIGDLSSIIDESIEFYWNYISENTIASDAHLHFKRIQAKLKCVECSTEYQLTDSNLPCPNCNSSNVQVIAGEEFYLDAIEIDN